MFYAVRLCANKNHSRYMRPIEFIVEYDENEDEVPCETETEEEMENKLKDNVLYNAGWVEIVEIDI